MGKGIDYGMGHANIDKKTGIRYGVISQHSVMPEALNELEPYYGEPHCPKCGEEVEETPGDRDIEEYEHSFGEDYVCERCRVLLDSSEVFGDEAQGFSYEREGYALTDCLDTDIFVLKSPYFTRGRFCSPCVPGAVNLDGGYDEEGERAYCLGHDWFESGKAPYRVFEVETGKEVKE